ncbi:hypothetical protein RYO59_002342 [Thermosynechococcaceae cyanobacterium Okahandja]
MLIPIATLSTVLLPMAALAHGVSLDYQRVIQITARYDNGEPMANATVQVFAPDQPQAVALQGITTAEGHFQFTPDQAGYWQVQVRQAGHGGTITVPVDLESTVRPLTLASRPVSLSQYTPVQVGIMVLAVVWGAIGTACFAWSRRHVQVE